MKFGLFGAGGFGREVMVTLLRRRWNQGQGQDFSDFVFVETKPTATSCNGIQIVSEQDFEAAQYTHFAVSIADATVRQAIAERQQARGKIPTTVVSDLASVSPIAQIEPGAIFCDFTSVTSNAVIGRHFHCNIYSYVAHDCRIGDFVTFAPAVRCNGNVHIEDYAYLGTGALIRQGNHAAPLVIAAAAVVGMGAVVTKSVAAGVTVAGNPARELARK